MVSVVLFDADGVLQRPHVRSLLRFRAGLGRHVGFLEALRLEARALTGRRDFRDDLSSLLSERGSEASADELVGLHGDVLVDAAALALVDAVRAGGVRVGLATNQQRHRGALMKAHYAGHFDETFYSFDVGAAKPDPAFFTRALDRLGCPASEVLFIDDQPPNVVAARRLGIRAAWHVWPQGVGHLRQVLRQHGVQAG